MEHIFEKKKKKKEGKKRKRRDKEREERKDRRGRELNDGTNACIKQNIVVVECNISFQEKRGR